MSFSVRAMAAQDLDRRASARRRDPSRPRAGPGATTNRYCSPAAVGPALTRCALVALSDGNLAGFAVASWLPQETAAEVEGLVVDEKYRRQGIGSALIGACMAWAANAGASSIRLEVRASNAAALALYQRHGFSAVGVRRAYYSAPVEDAVLLQAPLVSPTTVTSIILQGFGLIHGA